MGLLKPRSSGPNSLEEARVKERRIAEQFNACQSFPELFTCLAEMNKAGLNITSLKIMKDGTEEVVTEEKVGTWKYGNALFSLLKYYIGGKEDKKHQLPHISRANLDIYVGKTNSFPPNRVFVNTVARLLIDTSQPYADETKAVVDDSPSETKAAEAIATATTDDPTREAYLKTAGDDHIAYHMRSINFSEIKTAFDEYQAKVKPGGSHETPKKSKRPFLGKGSKIREFRDKVAKDAKDVFDL